MNSKTLAQAYAPFWITLSILVSFVGSVSWGLNLQNEIKWVSKNKAVACSKLSYQLAAQESLAQRVNKEAYNSTNTGINQVFVGNLITAAVVEKESIRQQAVHYGCPVTSLNSFTG